MGQKIHPLGLRVGITKKHKAKWFANSDQYPQFVLEDILLRKLVTSLIPPESLPRFFEDDKKMRVIEVQTERFIRNTIKIQIYAVNPDLSSLMLEKKKNRDYSSEENNNSSNKNNRKIFVEKNSKKELTISNENATPQKFTKWKNLLRKKIFELKCYQFKNIIKKCNVLLEIEAISNKTLHDTVVLSGNVNHEAKRNLNIILLKLKQLFENRHRIKLFLQRTLINKMILQLPTELENVKINLLYIYYNLRMYKINHEIFELQHDIIQINEKILKKFGILSKKWFINNNLRSIKRVLKKFEKQFKKIEKNYESKQNINDRFLFLKYPEILLRNYLQNSLNQQNNKRVNFRHQLENEYTSRFGNKLIKKQPRNLIKDLQTYLNWYSEKCLKVSKLTQKNQRKSVYYLSYRQLGQKVYIQKKKNYHKTGNFKNNEVIQKNIKIKKVVKRKIQNFMIDNLVKKNFYNNQWNMLYSSYQIHDFSKLIKQLALGHSFPKISAIEIIEIKQPSEYAVCLAYFITQKLEKRFSFRSVMKQAKRVAIQTQTVKGIKIQLSGRLNGAEIARTEWIREGRVPLQTLEADVDYSYKTAQTLYGIIGVKVWIFRKKTQY